MTEDGDSTCPTVSVSRPNKRAKVGAATSEVAPPVPEGVGVPDTYKAKRCRYCRKWSTQLCEWNLSGTVLGSWHPMLPWHRGSIDRPSGDLCKVCAIVPRPRLT